MTFAVVNPRAEGFGILLGDRWFRLALSDQPLQYYTRDSLAPRQDDQGSGGTNVLAIGHAFGRSNLTGGEGLDWWPRQVGEEEQARDNIRFWDSGNIDLRRPLAGRPHVAELVHEIASWWTPGSAPVDMGASADAVYVARGLTIERFDDWGSTTPANTETFPVAIVNIDVGSDDTVVATDVDGDVYIKPSRSEKFVRCYEGTVSGAVAQAAWWIKGRVIVAALDVSVPANGSMIEVAPGIGGTIAVPTSTPVVTVVDTYSGQMTACVDADHAIVACFTDGSLRSYVPQSDTAGGVPELTIRATTNVPRGEVPFALGHNLGKLLVFTFDEDPSATHGATRAYEGSVLDVRFDYKIGNLQLLTVWDNAHQTVPNYVYNVVPTRDEMIFSIDESIDNHNVWRYDVVTSGLFRQHELASSDMIGLVRFHDRIAFVDDTEVWLESNTMYAETGWLITPNITHGLNTSINWLAFVAEMLNLEEGGTAVTFWYSIDPEAILDRNSASWTLLQTYTDVGQSGYEITRANISATQIALKLEWQRSTNGIVSPQVIRFANRGMPAHRDWVIEAPINISDIVTAPNRKPILVPGLGDENHRHLLALQGAAVEVTLPDPPMTLRGIIDAVAAPVAYMTPRGSQGRYCVVRFVGNLITTDTGSSVQGNEALGIGGLGISLLGVENVA